MYVVAYYTVLAMRNESTVFNTKNIKILYNCLTLQLYMIQLSIWFDHHVVRLMYIDFNMDMVYL